MLSVHLRQPGHGCFPHLELLVLESFSQGLEQLRRHRIQVVQGERRALLHDLHTDLGLHVLQPLNQARVDGRANGGLHPSDLCGDARHVDTDLVALVVEPSEEVLEEPWSIGSIVRLRGRVELAQHDGDTLSIGVVFRLQLVGQRRQDVQQKIGLRPVEFVDQRQHIFSELALRRSRRQARL
eukprot:scaffold129_cov254-Pinguiococcus_pyrenoidosus.AAC.12